MEVLLNIRIQGYKPVRHQELFSSKTIGIVILDPYTSVAMCIRQQTRILTSNLGIKLIQLLNALPKSLNHQRLQIRLPGDHKNLNEETNAISYKSSFGIGANIS